MQSKTIVFRSDLKSTHWQTEIEGLAAIVRLVKYHPETILGDLNEIIAALNEECKNLRSQVSFCILCRVLQKYCKIRSSIMSFS